MTPSALREALIDVIDAVVHGRVTHVVMVEGDPELVIAMLRRHPHTTATLCGPPEVAGRAVVDAGLADRVDVETGDPAGVVPPGGDLYLIVDSVGRGSSADSSSLLERCHAAMASSARLIVCERSGRQGSVAVEALVRRWFDVEPFVRAVGGWQVLVASPRPLAII